MLLAEGLARDIAFKQHRREWFVDYVLGIAFGVGTATHPTLPESLHLSCSARLHYN